jgi:hypothetical protein
MPGLKDSILNVNIALKMNRYSSLTMFELSLMVMPRTNLHSDTISTRIFMVKHIACEKYHINIINDSNMCWLMPVIPAIQEA